MTYTYCNGTDVALQLQRAVFTTSSSPTLAAVESMIERNEDFINSYTGHSWKSVTITDEYLDPVLSEPSLGLRFNLQHRKLFTFSSGTDKFEIWNGTTWYDYVANKTEGRGSDYFVEYSDGIVWLMDKTNVYPKGVRLTYRYGNNSVNKSIEKACILLTASDILSMLDKVNTFVDDGGSNRLSHDRRIDLFRKEAMSILDQFREFKVL